MSQKVEIELRVHDVGERRDPQLQYQPRATPDHTLLYAFMFLLCLALLAMKI